MPFLSVDLLYRKVTGVEDQKRALPDGRRKKLDESLDSGEEPEENRVSQVAILRPAISRTPTMKSRVQRDDQPLRRPQFDFAIQVFSLAVKVS